MTAVEDRAEWLAWRRHGIGASDVAAIVGLSKWGSPWSVWADKTGLAPDQEDNDYLEYGRRAEPMIAGYFNDRTGLYLTHPQYLAVHPTHEHHRATLDGLASESPTLEDVSLSLGPIESKTADWKEWDEIPDGYQCQGLWQLHCTGLDHLWFAVMHNRKFRLYEMDRDDKAIALLVETVDEFWERYVLGDTPPPTDGHEATTKALASAFPEAEPGKVVDLTDLADLLPRLAEEKAAEKVHKEAAQTISNRIKAAMGEGETGLVNGEPVLTLNTIPGSTFTATRKPSRRLNILGGK